MLETANLARLLSLPLKRSILVKQMLRPNGNLGPNTPAGVVTNMDAVPFATSQRVTVRAQADIFVSVFYVHDHMSFKDTTSKADRVGLETNEMNIALLR